MPIAFTQIDDLWWQHRLDELGSIVTNIDDINQSIAIILSTPKGSDPHRPDFGSDIWRYIDWPIPRATPYIVREAVLAIEKWEPRVAVSRLDVFEFKGTERQTLRVSVAWAISNSDAESVVEVAF